MPGASSLNSGSKESSLAPQFKWLNNTFKVAEDYVTNPDLLEVRIRGFGSVPKCHGSGTLVYYLPFYRCNTNGNFLCVCTANVIAAGTNYTMEQQLECWVSLIGSPVPFPVFPLVKPPLVFPLAEPPLLFPLFEPPPVLGLLSSMPKRFHWGLKTIRAKIQETSDYSCLLRQITGRKIILIKCNAKCRYLKKLSCSGTLWQAFNLSWGHIPSYDPHTPPYPLYTCIHYTVYLFLFTQGRGGGGGELTREKVRGAKVHKAGRKYQHDWHCISSR